MAGTVVGAGTEIAVPVDAGALGKRLRRLRRERQLSQTDLGGSRFSGSYVSHVESGRRRLSEEMVDYFAAQLGVAPEALTTGDQPRGSASPGDTDRMLVSQEVQWAFTRHQFPRALRAADRAVSEARSRGDVAEAWAMGLMRARALYEDDRLAEAAAAAADLAQEPLARRLPHLGVEALLVAARSARSAGDLMTALTHADRASHLVTSGIGSSDLRADTHIVHISALMEADQVEQAHVVSDRLAATLDEIDSDHVRGMAHWTIGNVCFLGGDLEQGMARHTAAAQLLHPEVDLRMWGRFRKASATVRLQNGITGGVLELLNQAGDALRIVGNPSDLTELRLAEARLWMLQGDLDRARTMAEYSLEDESLLQAAHSRAEADQLLGEIETAAERPRAAAEAFLRAALKFEEAGAYRRSVDMWRRHAAAVA